MALRRARKRRPTEPVAPEEEPVTSRDEAGEPSGDEDPANEREILEKTDEVSESDAPGGDASSEGEASRRARAEPRRASRTRPARA